MSKETVHNQYWASADDAFELDPATTGLLVVDMQYGSAHKDYGWCRAYTELGMADDVAYYAERLEQIVPRIQQLERAFRAAGAPVLFLHVASDAPDYSDLTPRVRRRIQRWRDQGVEPPYVVVGQRDHDILDEIAPLPGELLWNKHGASAFTRSQFDATLQERGLKNLVMVGVATNYCVEGTLRDAADHGYDCVLVEDACGAVSAEIHERAVQSMRPFCRIASTATIVDEIREVAIPIAER